MATAVSVRPAGPPSKPKRPAPPALQTGANGTTSYSSPSPSLSSKRPPSGYKHPPSASTAGSNGIATPNGTASRLVRRKDSQKTGDAGKPRPGKSGPSDTGPGDKRIVKKIMEPYVKTTAYMLRKYRKQPPSFILHLHPTHFRFDQQDGTFSYNSPMRTLLENIKNQTVPHEMQEELHQAGIKFYESCLIVQIHDHRNTSNATISKSSGGRTDTNRPHSIHNYEQWITPSPYVPYPNSKANDDQAESNASAATASGEADGITTHAKEKGQDSSSTDTAAGPRIFTTVLFPTAMTLQEEMMRYASAVDNRPTRNKQSQANSARTPASATTPHSSTGLASGPPMKKHKSQYSYKTLQTIESTIIMATAPPLYLEPVKNVREMKELYEKLSDPLHNQEPPAPKSRKRTVAELAADEALAAEQQRFMLIMDERLAPSSTGSGVGKVVGADGDGGGTAFEARFERFKALEEIKDNIRERKEREAEQRAQQQQQQLLMKAKLEQEREKQVTEQKMREMQAAKRQEQIMRSQQLSHQHVLPQQMMQPQQQLGQPQVPNQTQISNSSTQHAHPATSGAMMPNSHQLAVSQAAHSSPVIRNMTPQNVASPAMGNVIARGQGMPMTMTNSSQGAGSPPRPGSAIPHGHPAAVSMAPQRSQQPPSRNGTPAIANGTPRIQQATPVVRNVTPTPRISQASPVNSAAASTPMMGHNMIGAAHINGQPQLTPQVQHQIFLQQQAQHQQQQARQHAAMVAVAQQRQHLQGSPQPQLTQHQIQQMAAQQRGHQPSEEQLYRQHLQQSMHAQSLNHTMGNGIMGNPMQFGNAQQQQQQQQLRQLQTAAASFFNQMRNTAMQQYGENIPQEIIAQMKTQAQNRARMVVAQRSNHYQQQHQQAMIAAQMQRSATMNGMGGM